MTSMDFFFIKYKVFEHLNTSVFFEQLVFYEESEFFLINRKDLYFDFIYMN